MRNFSSVKKKVTFVEASKAKLIWAETCKVLADTLTPDEFGRWIEVISAAGDEYPGVLTLMVPHGFYQDWLEENYLPRIQQALVASGGENLTITFMTDETPAAPVAAPVARPAEMPSPKKKVLSSYNQGGKLTPDHTFDNFVVGPSNSFAHASAMAVAKEPGRAYNPLFIHGGTGLGKTHLMQAIGLTVLEKGKGTICYTSSESFTNEFIQALQQHKLTEFRNKYRNMDVLLIDDIHFLAGKESTQEEFFHTFNALFQNQKQIVMTSDRPISEIANLQKRLVSRFEWGLVTEMDMPDLETRVAILRQKCEQRKLELPDSVLFFIAEHVRSNIRKLEGSLLRVASYASLTRKTLTPDLLEHLLRDTIEQENQSAITIEDIQRAVAEYFDIRLGDMTGKQRPKNIAVPRQVAMFLSRELTDHSLPSIGNAFGRNHATVLHAHRTITDKMKSDSSLRQSIQSIRQHLGAPIGIK